MDIDLHNFNEIKMYLTMQKLMHRDAFLKELICLNDLVLVGESSTGLKTLKEIERSSANLLIIEEDLSDSDGLTISESVLKINPLLNILLLVDCGISHQRLAIYLDSGIKAVVSKSSSIDKLIYIINYIKNGQVYIGEEVFKKESENEDKALDLDRFKELSPREQEVATLISNRIEIKEIANKLEVSHKTIHSYKDRIFIKLNMEKISELILFMQRIKLKEKNENF